MIVVDVRENFPFLLKESDGDLGTSSELVSVNDQQPDHASHSRCDGSEHRGGNREGEVVVHSDSEEREGCAEDVTEKGLSGWIQRKTKRVSFDSKREKDQGDSPCPEEEYCM